MSTSVISMPSRASWSLSRRQYPHQGVVYIVSGWVMPSPSLEPFSHLNTTNVRVCGVLPGWWADLRVALAALGRRCRKPRAGWPLTDEASGDNTEVMPLTELADGADAVLTALDPQQREVALAVRGP